MGARLASSSRLGRRLCGSRIWTSSWLLTPGTGYLMGHTTVAQSLAFARHARFRVLWSSAGVTKMTHVSRRRSNELQRRPSPAPDRLLADTPALVMRLASATDIPSLVDTFGSAATTLGFPNYVISRVLRSRSSSARRTAIEMIGAHYPQEWVRYYQGRDYASTDPVHRAAFIQSTPYRWHDIAGLSKAERRLLDEAKEAGLPGGLSIPVHEADGSVLLFNLSGPLHSVNDAIKSRIACLISTQFHLELHRLSQIPRRRTSRVLTPCQTVCLTWVARGKTSAEIAEILGRSPYTVDYHVGKATEALNIYGRTAAAVYAAVQGIIKP